ncbi:MAG: tyrosine-type recombinase/integrase [Candidatus Parabeggiatoa sp.]|nr:tyrosine-type recombinase/integrase [Candidatus Parabeggiatoa sp.]
MLDSEVDALLDAARKSKHFPHRNYCLVLLMYRHALRLSEAIGLTWDQIDLKSESFYVERLKGSVSSTHPLRPIETMALKLLKQESSEHNHVFISQRDKPLASRGVQKLMASFGKDAGISFPVHPHMLRHACGYRLANEGRDTRVIQAYLGHKDIRNTVIYTELSPKRFDSLFLE